MNAKTYFEDCRAQVRRFARVEQRYAELCDTSIGAIKYDDSHGGNGDPMARVDEAIDYEQVVSERRAELHETLDYANAILYGADGHGGLSKLKGSIYADSICMHYLQDERWTDIARLFGTDGKQVRYYAMSGLRAIDRVGFARLIEGEKA